MAPLTFFKASFSEGDAAALFSYWSFVHLASGIVAGTIAYIYLRNEAASITTLCLLALLLFQVWEVIEHSGYMLELDGWAFYYEHPVNKLTDIIVDLIGFVFVIWVSGVDVA